MIQPSDGSPNAIESTGTKESGREDDNRCTSSDTAHSSSCVDADCASSQSHVDTGVSSDALSGHLSSACRAMPAQIDTVPAAEPPPHTQHACMPAAAATGQSEPCAQPAPDQDAGHLLHGPECRPGSAVPGPLRAGTRFIAPAGGQEGGHSSRRAQQGEGGGAVGDTTLRQTSVAVSGRGLPKDKDKRRKLALQARLAALMRIEAQRGLRKSIRQLGA